MEFNSQGCDILSPPPDWLSQLPQASALLQGYSSFKTVIEDGMSVPGCGNDIEKALLTVQFPEPVPDNVTLGGSREAQVSLLL